MITLCTVHGKTSADFLPLLEPVSINRVNHIPYPWRIGKGRSSRHSLGGGERALVRQECLCAGDGIPLYVPLCSDLRSAIRSKAAIIPTHCAAAVDRRRLQNGSRDSAEAWQLHNCYVTGETIRMVAFSWKESLYSWRRRLFSLVKPDS